MSDESLYYDSSEFREIYNRNISTVYKIAYMHLKNKNDAEDVAQTVFLKFINTRPVFREREHEKAWFIVTARNQSRDILKHWWNRGRTESENIAQQSYRSFDNSGEGWISETLLKLPASYREVLYLYYYEEYSVKEISEILKKSETSVRTNLCRAREKVKKILEKEDKSDEQIRSYQGV